MARLEECEKLKLYIEEISGKFETAQMENYKVGNSVIDAVLNYYISMLDTNVDIQILGICSENIKMSDVELCTVVSNIIQNAVEALAELTDADKRLFVECQRVKGYIQMKVKNSCQADKIIFDNKVESQRLLSVKRLNMV